MNIGLPELGILGVLALLIFGGKKFKSASKKKEKEATKGKNQTDIMANFQNVNSDYDNTPIKKSDPLKS